MKKLEGRYGNLHPDPHKSPFHVNAMYTLDLAHQRGKFRVGQVTATHVVLTSQGGDVAIPLQLLVVRSSESGVLG